MREAVLGSVTARVPAQVALFLPALSGYGQGITTQHSSSDGAGRAPSFCGTLQNAVLPVQASSWYSFERAAQLGKSPHTGQGLTGQSSSAYTAGSAEFLMTPSSLVS